MFYILHSFTFNKGNLQWQMGGDHLARRSQRQVFVSGCHEVFRSNDSMTNGYILPSAEKEISENQFKREHNGYFPEFTRQ